MKNNQIQHQESTLSEHIILKIILWSLIGLLGLGVFNSGAYIATNAKFLGPEFAISIGIIATVFYIYIVIKFRKVIEVAVYVFLAYKMYQDLAEYLESFTQYIGLENATVFFKNITQGNGFF